MTELILERRYHYYYPGVFVLRLLNSLIGIIEAGFALRLVLELFGADPASQFVALVYDITGRLLGPFVGAFPNLSLGGNSILDIATILGMIIYAVVGLAFIRLLAFIFSSANLP